ncbi:RNA-directed DNA polymerase, eukaryota [Tanacetum coccineum]
MLSFPKGQTWELQKALLAPFLKTGISHKFLLITPNQPWFLTNLGFQNVKLKYLGGMWFLLELDTIASQEKLLNHIGASSWFTNIKQASNSFKCDEWIVWDDVVEDKAGEKDTNGASDVDRVLESSFTHVNDLVHELFNNSKQVQSLSNKLKGRKMNDGVSFQHSMNSCTQKSNVGRSILDVMDEVVKVGQTIDSSMFIKEHVSKYDNFVALMGTWTPSSTKLLIIFVYAPQELTKKRDLWNYLRLLINRWEGNTVIMGDFNEARSKHERFGTMFNSQGANAFNNFISLAGLIDLPLEGYAYTWAQKSASKMSKLNRFLFSECLLTMFPHLSTLCLDRHQSDHHPILMRKTRFDYGPTPF